jgi:inorganic pyrophosphatase
MLYPALFYPCNYGFIPQTREEGGGADPIDVFILGNYSLLAKSVISCRAVGILSTEDQGGIDTTLPFKQEGHISTVTRKLRYDVHQ